MSSCTPRSTAYSQFDGWRIVGATALAVGGFVGAIAASAPDSDDAVHIVMRVTARMAVVLFLLAFSASSVAQLWPSAWTRWQRRNRRYLGVSFAVAHFTHFLAILSLRVIAPDHFATIPAVTWIFGGIAYVFVAAMTATSFDATAKAAGSALGQHDVARKPEFAKQADGVIRGVDLVPLHPVRRRALLGVVVVVPAFAE